MQQMQDIIDRQTSELNLLNQELRLANQELSRLSTLDELTQIVNRRQLINFLNREWEHLSALKKPLSAIMCDVDNFKAYNDTYGHLAGDECLIKIAQVLRNCTRQNADLVARYGGEEFAIILPNTDIKGAERVAQKIMAEVQTQQIPHSFSGTISFVTISLGVATIVPDHRISPIALLDIADKLLYQSKERGRNTYTLQSV